MYKKHSPPTAEFSNVQLRCLTPQHSTRKTPPIPQPPIHTSIDGSMDKRLYLGWLGYPPPRKKKRHKEDSVKIRTVSLYIILFVLTLQMVLHQTQLYALGQRFKNALGQNLTDIETNDMQARLQINPTNKFQNKHKTPHKPHRGKFRQPHDLMESHTLPNLDGDNNKVLTCPWPRASITTITISTRITQMQHEITPTTSLHDSSLLAAVLAQGRNTYPLGDYTGRTGSKHLNNTHKKRRNKKHTNKSIHREQETHRVQHECKPTWWAGSNVNIHPPITAQIPTNHIQTQIFKFEFKFEIQRNTDQYSSFSLWFQTTKVHIEHGGKPTTPEDYNMHIPTYKQTPSNDNDSPDMHKSRSSRSASRRSGASGTKRSIEFVENAASDEIEETNPPTRNGETEGDTQDMITSNPTPTFDGMEEELAKGHSVTQSAHTLDSDRENAPADMDESDDEGAPSPVKTHYCLWSMPDDDVQRILAMLTTAMGGVWGSGNGAPSLRTLGLQGEKKE